MSESLKKQAKTFGEIVKLRKIVDGVHNPYIYGKLWVHVDDAEGQIADLKEKLQNKTFAYKELMNDKLKLQEQIDKTEKEWGLTYQNLMTNIIDLLKDKEELEGRLQAIRKHDKDFPFKFANCQCVVKLINDEKEIAAQCFICPQADCCKWYQKLAVLLKLKEGEPQ